jgi:hypothetical protein
MPRELDLLGLYVPSLLVLFVGSMPVYWLLDGALAHAGCYRHVWHIDLFRLCLFVILFGSVGLYLFR